MCCRKLNQKVLIHFIFAFIHSLPKVVVTFLSEVEKWIKSIFHDFINFQSFLYFLFQIYHIAPVSHLSTNYIFQNKPVKNYYNLWKYDEYRKNNNQGRTMDENITNIAFGYGKHLWMISIEIWLLPTYLQWVHNWWNLC